MTIEKYRKIVTQDVEVNLIQDRLARILAQIADDPITDRQRIEISLTTGIANRVYHLLGRQPKGWFITDKNANANVWRASWNSEYIDLRSSANVTLILEVF